MQPAPAVSFDADDGGIARATLAAVAALAVAVLARWGLGWAGADGFWALPATLLALLAGAAAAAWIVHRSRPPSSRLTWDTRVWSWQAPGAAPVAGRLRVAVDLCGWMLLAFDPERPAAGSWFQAWSQAWLRAWSRRWVAVGATGAAVRAALYAAAPAPRVPA
jgi:hypothetical protein